jgi:E3 ubiquitin-protein ligase UBR4
VSVYYSHALQMLFFSFSKGLTFAAPLTKVEEDMELKTLFRLKLPSLTSNQSQPVPTSTSSSGGGQTGAKIMGAVQLPKIEQQPLCQWEEVNGHPGLITCMTQLCECNSYLAHNPKQSLN